MSRQIPPFAVRFCKLAAPAVCRGHGLGLRAGVKGGGVRGAAALCGVLTLGVDQEEMCVTASEATIGGDTINHCTSSHGSIPSKSVWGEKVTQLRPREQRGMDTREPHAPLQPHQHLHCRRTRRPKSSGHRHTVPGPGLSQHIRAMAGPSSHGTEGTAAPDSSAPLVGKACPIAVCA